MAESTLEVPPTRNHTRRHHSSLYGMVPFRLLYQMIGVKHFLWSVVLISPENDKRALQFRTMIQRGLEIYRSYEATEYGVRARGNHEGVCAREPELTL